MPPGETVKSFAAGIYPLRRDQSIVLICFPRKSHEIEFRERRYQRLTDPVLPWGCLGRPDLTAKLSGLEGPRPSKWKVDTLQKIQ
jgi:hypothetical protein